VKRPDSYQTKQREAITAFLKDGGGTHVTAGQLAAHFERIGAPIGVATIYRQLDKLVESGRARKFVTDGVSGSCYQYIDDHDDCHAHLHLKCDSCGDLLHLGNEALGEIRRHVYDNYSFEMSSVKTVLYGTCERCLQK
jgi:Fur family ferric uptake transcriptional regulator